MNILGIDYGQKRIGLAWMQTGIDVILPYGVVAEKDMPDFVKKEKIDLLVLGLPLGLDGKENENTARVRVFGEGLARETGLLVEYADERYTTAEAGHLGKEGAMADEKAAMIILQSYLDRKKYERSFERTIFCPPPGVGA